MADEGKSGFELKRTTLTLENQYGKYSVSVNQWDMNVQDMIGLMQSVLAAAGYSREALREYIEDV